jgi:S1-C subfamily serine protease
MTKQKFLMTVTVLVLGFGVMPMVAQEREQRRDIERRIDELRGELRQLERELGDLRGDSRYFRGLVTLSTNRAQLGVFVQTEADPATDDIGALLQSVNEGGAAAEAGLQDGDIVTSFDGEPLAGRYPAAGRNESQPARKLIDLIGEKEPGDEVTVEYQRGGQTHSTVVTLGEPEGWFTSFGRSGFEVVRPPGVSNAPRPDIRIFGNAGGGFQVFSLLGDPWSDIELVTLSEDLGRYFGTTEGLLVIAPPEDEEMNLRAGDVILNIDGRDPRTPSRALRILRSYEDGETINLEVMRDRNRMTISYTIPEREDHTLRRYDWNWDQQR